MKSGGVHMQRSTYANECFVLINQCVLGFIFLGRSCVLLGSFVHELPKGEIVSIFVG